MMTTNSKSNNDTEFFYVEAKVDCKLETIKLFFTSSTKINIIN